MQTADPRKSDDLPGFTPLDSARDRRDAVEAHVGTILVMEEVTLAEHHHVIEQLAP